jgi:hypothetical protein
LNPVPLPPAPAAAVAAVPSALRPPPSALTMLPPLPTSPPTGLLFLVMELLQGGQLFALLQRESFLAQDGQCAFYAGEIILALEHLHSHGVVHRCVPWPAAAALGARGCGCRGSLPCLWLRARARHSARLACMHACMRARVCLSSTSARLPCQPPCMRDTPALSPCLPAGTSSPRTSCCAQTGTCV